MTTPILERVTLDRTTPDRAFANVIALELLEGGAATGANVARVVLTLTPIGGETPLVVDSQDEGGLSAGNPFYFASGVLYLDLSAINGLVSGAYNVQLDVYDGVSWYAWGRGQPFRILVEA